MNRREFIKGIGLASALSYISYNESFRIKTRLQTKKELDMFEKIGQYVHKIETKLKFTIPTSGEEIKTRIFAYGIAKNRKFYTVAHCVHIWEYQQMTPFGVVKFPAETLEAQTTLNDVPLKIKFINTDKDIAVFEIPEYYNIPEIPGTIENVKVGDKIYVIGSPHLKGINIREGRVSDSDGFDGQEWFFGYDVPLVGGDSGTPILDKNFNLVGLNSHVINHTLGYGVRFKGIEDEC
jgi:hypothetical protein